MNDANFLVKKCSAKQTLLRMNVGQTIIVSERNIRYMTLYSTARVIEKTTDMRFSITIKGIVGGTKVTRTA